MITMPRWLALLTILGSLTLRADGQTQDTAPWPAVEKPRVEVTFTAHQSVLNAQVRATCRITNSGGSADTAGRWFPLGLTMQHFAQENPAAALRVLVDGEPVEVTLKRVFEAPDENQFAIARHDPAAPTSSDFEEWNKRLLDWATADPELSGLMFGVSTSRQDRDALNAINSKFKERVKKHLIHEDLTYIAVQVACGDHSSLLRFMPEIDPTLRADIEFQRRKYISFLEGGDQSRFDPFHAQWQKQADEWFQSKPDLAELLPELRSRWQTHRKRSALINGPLVTYLHDRRGLSLGVAQDVARWTSNGHVSFSQASPARFLQEMFPDLDDKRLAAKAERDKRLRRLGFDRKIVSSTTGELFTGTAAPPPRTSHWRDQTVERILSGDAGDKVEDRTWGRMSEVPFLPSLLTFDAPLEPGASADITIEYTVPVSPLSAGMQASYRPGPRGLPELQCALPPAWKRLPTDVEISVPPQFLAVVSPSPDSTTANNSGTVYTSRLTTPDANPHVVPVPGYNTWLMRISPGFMGPNASRDEITKLASAVRNESVRPLMLALQYRDLMTIPNRWRARQLAQLVAEKYPASPDITKQRELHPSANDMDKVCAWIEKKSKSPQLDFGRALFDRPEDHTRLINENASGNYRVLSSAELTELGELLRQQDESKLSLPERVGRHCLLCQAGIDRKKNLQSMLDLGDRHPEVVVSVLNCIAAMSVEKSEAVRFVIRQIDPRQHLNRDLRGDNPARLQQMSANWALQSFRSPKAALPLIAFTGTTEDPLLIQSTMRSLSRMATPELFNDLAGIADRLAGSRGVLSQQYIDLLGRCDRPRALLVLPQLRQQFPESSSVISAVLAQLGDRRELDAAIKAYETGEREVAQNASNVLQNLATPDDIATLKYRSGLPHWCNEQLVFVIRLHGGPPEAFDFVERYYHEFVRGKPKFQYMTCIAAFTVIGDKRALPHLREILTNTERKSDAAQAIGTLQLGLRRSPSAPIIKSDNLHSSISRLMNGDSNNARREADWKLVLTDPEVTMQSIMQREIRWSIGLNNNGAMSARDLRRFAFLTRFGELPARSLLEASRGCSLPERYQFAQILSLLSVNTLPLIRSSAFDADADESERRTALLALGIVKDDASTNNIAAELNNLEFRMSAIDALERVESTGSETALAQFQKTLAELPNPDFYQQAALQRLACWQRTR